MPDQPPSDRFKADMPQIPGVSSLGAPSPPRDSSLKLGIGLLLVLVVVFLGARWALHPRHTEPRVADQPQIEVATPGKASVACGSRVLGSGAGVGTSICGWSATRGSVCLGWSAQRAPRKTTTSTRRSPIPSLREESRGGDGVPSEDTPGICGMSALKRSDGG